LKNISSLILEVVYLIGLALFVVTVQLVNTLVLLGFLHGLVMAEASFSLSIDYLLAKSTKYSGLLPLSYYITN